MAPSPDRVVVMSRIRPVVSIRSSLSGFTYPPVPAPTVADATSWVTVPWSPKMMSSYSPAVFAEPSCASP